MSKLKKVISIDGGGIRGIIAIKVLQAIEEGMQEQLTDRVSLMAGTSTGAIIAGGISSGVPAGKLLEGYVDMGKSVFNVSLHRKIKTVGGLFGGKYDIDILQDSIRGIIKDRKLSDTLCDTLMVTYNMAKARAEFLTTSRDKGLSLLDAMTASSAAPTYFDPKIIGNNEYIDGGLVCNNPAMAAFAEIKTLHNTRAQDIFLVSVGTGDTSTVYTGGSKWFKLRWVNPLLDIGVSGDMGVVHNQLVKIYKSVGKQDNYYRINELLPQGSSSKIDDITPGNIKGLLELGDLIVAKNEKKISKIVERLKY